MGRLLRQARELSSYSEILDTVKALLMTRGHSKGLKLGIYSLPGPKTLWSSRRAYKHEAQDARRTAAGASITSSMVLLWPDCTQTGPRRVYYDVMLRGGAGATSSQLASTAWGDVWTWRPKWAGTAGGTTGDINDVVHMSGIGFKQNGHER